jgi:hypothetical protein
MTDEQWKIILQFLNEYRNTLDKLNHIDEILTAMRERL